MSTIYAPTTEVVCASVVAEATSKFRAVIAAAASPAAEPAVQPAYSFLTPTICSWIITPYYPAPSHEPIEVVETLVQSESQIEIQSETGNEVQEQIEDEIAEQAYPLEGFDLSRLAPSLVALACERVKSHVHAVIDLLEKGGDAACTFGNIFLNDLALQRTVLAGLMNEPGNPLSDAEFPHKELAVRLAACGAARDVARLLLAEA